MNCLTNHKKIIDWFCYIPCTSSSDDTFLTLLTQMFWWLWGTCQPVIVKWYSLTEPRPLITIKITTHRLNCTNVTQWVHSELNEHSGFYSVGLCGDHIEYRGSLNTAGVLCLFHHGKSSLYVWNNMTSIEHMYGKCTSLLRSKALYMHCALKCIPVYFTRQYGIYPIL